MIVFSKKKTDKNLFYLVQLQKNEEALPDAKEFDQLKEHFEKHLRVNSPPSLPTSFLSFSSSTAFSKYMGSHFHHDTQMQQGKLDDIQEYEPSVHIPDNDLKLLDSMITLRNVDGGKLYVLMGERRKIADRVYFYSLHFASEIYSTL